MFRLCPLIVDFCPFYGVTPYSNVIENNNLCGSNTSIYMFDGEKRRQDNTIKGNACNGAGDGLDIAGGDPIPDRPPLARREDVPKAVLPDTSKAQEIANAALTGLATARQVLTQATATKLPSLSMAEMREQIAGKNTEKCN